MKQDNFSCNNKTNYTRRQIYYSQILKRTAARSCQVVLAAMLEDQKNHTTLLKNQSAIKYLP